MNKQKEIEQAMKRLRRLKVYQLCYAVGDSSLPFAEIWWSVLHEVDMYVEGEFPASDGGMNKAQAKRADAWLIETADLAEWSARNEDGMIGQFGETAFQYGGQV